MNHIQDPDGRVFRDMHITVNINEELMEKVRKHEGSDVNESDDDVATIVMLKFIHQLHGGFEPEYDRKKMTLPSGLPLARVTVEMSALMYSWLISACTTCKISPARMIRLALYRAAHL